MPEEDRSNARAHAWLGLLFSPDGAIPMRLLGWECWCAIIASLMTLAFVPLPGTYEMAVFTFLASPLPRSTIS